MSEPQTADAQVDQIEARVRGAFLELTMAVGGIIAEHPVNNTAVFAISRSVEKAYRSCMAPLANLRAAESAHHPLLLNESKHPAILHLLTVIDTKQQH